MRRELEKAGMPLATDILGGPTVFKIGEAAGVDVEQEIEEVQEGWPVGLTIGLVGALVIAAASGLIIATFKGNKADSSSPQHTPAKDPTTFGTLVLPAEADSKAMLFKHQVSVLTQSADYGPPDAMGSLGSRQAEAAQQDKATVDVSPPAMPDPVPVPAPTASQLDTPQGISFV